MFRLFSIEVGKMASGPFRISHAKKRDIMAIPYLQNDSKATIVMTYGKLTNTMVIITPASLQGFVFPPHCNPSRNKNTPMKLSPVPIQSSPNHVSQADFLCTVRLGRLGMKSMPKTIPSTPIYCEGR